MNRLIVVLVGTLLLLGGAPWPVAAQSTASTSVPGPSGEELARIAVSDVVDPFEPYDPASPPIRGYHYVLVTLAVENSGPRAFQVDPGTILLRDADGFLYGAAQVRRDETAAAADLPRQELAPGETATGAVGFQVLNDVALAEVLLEPGSGQLVQLHEFGDGEPAALGDAVEVLGNEGAEVGTVAVRELTDPYEDYPAGSAPERGSHFVTLTVAVVNTGPRPLQVDPGAVLLQDTDGFLYGAQSVPLGDAVEPALARQELAPGDAARGTVGFVVVTGVTLSRVLYQPAGDRLLVLADLASAGGRTPDAGAERAATPAAESGEVDCAAIHDWLIAANTDASAVMGVVGTVMVMQVQDDPEFGTVAHQVAAAFAVSAEGLRSRPVPAAVEALNRQLADAYDAYGAALEAYATATEAGDQAAIDEAGRALHDAEPALISSTTAVGELATTCGIDPSA